MISCEIKKISCGNLVVGSNIGVEQSDGGNTSVPAIRNKQEFIQQISGIVNNTELSMYYDILYLYIILYTIIFISS